MLYGRTVRSPVPRGRLRGVTLGAKPPRLVIVGPRDIPGRNVIRLIEDDQPCLADGEVRHAEEPVLLLAHEDREQLLAVSVAVDVETTEPVFDPRQSPHVFKEIT